MSTHKECRFCREEPRPVSGNAVKTELKCFCYAYPPYFWGNKPDNNFVEGSEDACKDFEPKTP